MADRWFQSTGKIGLLKVIAPLFFNGFSRGQWQTLIEHLKSNIMEKVSENPLFCRNLQANRAQFFWDTLYNTDQISRTLEKVCTIKVHFLEFGSIGMQTAVRGRESCVSREGMKKLCFGVIDLAA